MLNKEQVIKRLEDCKECSETYKMGVSTGFMIAINAMNEEDFESNYDLVAIVNEILNQ